MKKLLAKYVIFTLLGLMGMSVFSQSQGCRSSNIEDIGEKCVQKSIDKLENQKIPIKDLKHGYYTFEDPSGKLGLINFYAVKGLGKKDKECVLYYKAKDFSKNQVFENTVSIKHESGFWGEKFFGSNRFQNKDFLLKRSSKKNTCYIETNGSRVAKFKKFNQFLLPEGNEMLFNAGWLFAALAVFIFAFSIFTDEDKFQTEQALDEDEDAKKSESKNLGIVFKYSRPFFRRYLSPVVGGMKNKKQIKERYKRRLASSGLNRYMTPEDFYAFKIFLILGFPLTFIGVREFMEADWPLSIIPIISVVGFFYPDFWAKGTTERREKEIVQNMPFIVDMLALSVEAGLDFMAAITRVVEKAPPSAISEEFEILLKEVKVGASRAEALRNLAWRIDSIMMSSFCATLIAADSVGASVGPILKALSQDIRRKKSSFAEKQGAAAATKLLIPMILIILPAVFLMIFLPFIPGGF